MPTLRRGTRIALTDGSTVTVGRFLGAGGQGEVYAATDNDGNDKALKWFTNPSLLADSRFAASMADRCQATPPGTSFLWPQALTVPYGSAFGYIMPLKPANYIELGDFFCIDRNPEAYFRSSTARLNAAIAIADSFSRLHLAGCCYQDINDGNFFADPFTGDILICDNENIVVNGHGHNIAGKPRYMAPEVAAGARPSTASDRLSLAVVLYRIFMTDHPFEGIATASGRYRCLSPEDEAIAFGSNAVFCHDADNASNRPHPELHPNSLRFWPAIPQTLKKAFQVSLSSKSLANPAARPASSRWKTLLCNLRSCLLTCHADRSEPVHDFLADTTLPPLCPRCGKPMAPFATLAFDIHHPYRLSAGKSLFLGDSLTAEGRCSTMNVRGRGVVLGLENTGTRTWTVQMPSGKAATASPGCSVVFADGCKIDFGTCRASVIFPTPCL